MSDRIGLPHILWWRSFDWLCAVCFVSDFFYIQIISVFGVFGAVRPLYPTLFFFLTIFHISFPPRSFYQCFLYIYILSIFYDHSEYIGYPLPAIAVYRDDVCPIFEYREPQSVGNCGNDDVENRDSRDHHVLMVMV